MLNESGRFSQLFKEFRNSPPPGGATPYRSAKGFGSQTEIDIPGTAYSVLIISCNTEAIVIRYTSGKKNHVSFIDLCPEVVNSGQSQTDLKVGLTIVPQSQAPL